MTASTEPPPEAFRKAMLVPPLWALLLAASNAVAIVQRSASQPARERVLHVFFDAGQMLALGLLLSVACLAWMRFASRFWSRFYLPVAIASWGIAALSLPSSLEGAAERLFETLPFGVVLWVGVTLSSLTLPLALFVGLRAARTRWRYAACGIALGAGSLNNFVLDRDYYGIHLFVVLNAFVLGSAALSGVQLDRLREGLGRSPLLSKVFLSRRAERAGLAFLILYAVVSLVLPSNQMSLRLTSLEGAPLARAAAGARQLFAREVDASLLLANMPSARRQWFENRDALPPVAPSPTLLPEAPIVILLTVDCLRADLLTRKKLEKRLPHLREFQKASVSFENARATGAATVPSLASIFSGKHYSQMRWQKRGRGNHVWPTADDSVRFPELLNQAGVRTITVASKRWLTNNWGIVRGFSVEEDLDQNRKPRSNHVKSGELLPKLQQQLEKVGHEPVFVYAHIMDPHAPYNYGKRKKGSAFDRYVSEVERFGSHLKEFEEWLRSRGLFERTSIIISADHGEAFGEHDTYEHSKTVYDELLRVPLWIRIPSVEPRRVDEPVSLIDLGPTLLDLFGQATPGHYMGQSLVPQLRGDATPLSRPIAAEARLLQTLVFPDRMKAIRDVRRGTYELYDLVKDPKEKNNLEADGGEQHFGLLNAFFTLHLHPSYEQHAPFRP